MNNTINVFELQPGICYVFAVRAYNPVAIRFGGYSVVNGSTIAEGNNIIMIIKYKNIQYSLFYRNYWFIQ